MKIKIKKTVLSLLLLVVVSVGLYTGVHLISTVSGADMLENMVADSKTKSTEFEGGVSVDDGGKTLGITFIADNDSEISEMYFAEKVQWFGSDTLSRFELAGHYYTVNPIGVAYETIKTDNGKIKYAFLYTNNVNEISNVYIQMKNGTNIYWEKAYFPSKQPSVQVVELKNEQTEVQYIVCYDIDGNMIYEKGIKADF